MRQRFSIIVLFLLFYGMPVLGQNAEIPEEYVLIKEVYGDVDKDGQNEKVAVYNMTNVEDDFQGISRELVVYKRKGNNWTIWKRSKEAIGGSKDGGMMGDPFEGIEIKNGILLVYQSGGSSWKWSNVDKYRFQNSEFELIGYSTNFGKLCEYWENIDFNISTRQLTIKKEYEECQNEEQNIYKKENETFTYKLKESITIQNRKKNKIKIVSPKYKHEIYI